MTESSGRSPMVVLGESLAAGLINFSLHQDGQRGAFPRLVARQLGITLSAPEFQPPGVGDAIGFPSLPVMIPHDTQTTVVSPLPSDAWYDHLAVPGLTAAEALNRRPAAPLVHRNDARQTAINYILGTPALLAGGGASLPTQLEYALARRPELAILELGFAEAMDAAAAGVAESMPVDVAFRESYGRIVSALCEAGAAVVVTTVPDPMDTAHCATLDAAARLLKMPSSRLRRQYGLGADDRILVNGLVEIGVQIMSKRMTTLPTGMTLSGSAAASISARVAAMNAAIVAVAQQHRAMVVDFAGLFRRVRRDGVAVGQRRLTGDFLGGFFSLNGYTPGATGQAMLANAVIDALGQDRTRFGGAAPQRVDVEAISRTDPVVDYRHADGPPFKTAAGTIAAAGAGLRLAMFLAGFVAKAVAGAVTRKKYRPAAERGNDPARWTLKLPPALTQTLPIEPRASYYGDALMPLHTAARDEQQLGLSGRLLFGGVALFDSHLRGKVRVRFYPPANNVAHFEVTHPGGLKGDDTRLAAPLFFQLAGIESQVMDSTSLISSGDLNLITGEVTNLRYYLFLLNSAILALAAVNPTLPKDPIALPGEHGRAWARFEQRPDGLLDYTAYATSFIPLSVLKVPIRFPLPFVGPSGSVASIGGDGTSLHPHFCVSTRAPQPVPGWSGGAVPQMQLQHVETADGRWQVQFGHNFGGTVSIAVRPLPSANTTNASVAAPPSDPMLDDRLNLPVGAIDVASGSIMPPHGSRLPALHWENGRLVVGAAAQSVSRV